MTLRNHIAAQLDEGVPPLDPSSLSSKLLEIAKQIAEIDAQVESHDVGVAASMPDELWLPA